MNLCIYLTCLIVGGVVGAFMGYKAGFGAGELYSLYKGAAAAAKREEDEFERKMRRYFKTPKAAQEYVQELNAYGEKK